MNDLGQKTGITASGKLRIALLGIFVAISGGTIGFMALENMEPLDALYMTIITLSTVGFSEVTPLHPAGRLFVILLIVFGVIAAGSIATFLGEQVLEGQFKNLVARRKMENKLKKMRDHFIIAGYGRVGRQVAEDFLSKKVSFVMIERDGLPSAKLLPGNVVYLQGDATDDDTLLEAGIDRARTLISTLPDEAQNVYLTLTARHMNPDLNIIARADFEEGEKKLRRAGANHVVIPHVIGGIRMAKAALQPNVVDFMHLASVGEEGLLIEEMVVGKDSPLAGKTLAESNLKQEYGVTIIGIKQMNKKMDINPSSATLLNFNDVIVVIGHIDDLERLSHGMNK